MEEIKKWGRMQKGTLEPGRRSERHGAAQVPADHGSSIQANDGLPDHTTEFWTRECEWIGQGPLSAAAVVSGPLPVQRRLEGLHSIRSCALQALDPVKGALDGETGQPPGIPAQGLPLCHRCAREHLRGSSSETRVGKACGQRSPQGAPWRARRAHRRAPPPE